MGGEGDALKGAEEQYESDPAQWVEQGEQVNVRLPWRNRTMEEIEARFRDATTIPDVCGPTVCYAPNNAELGLIGLVMCERVRLLAQREKGLRELLRKAEPFVYPDDLADEIDAVLSPQPEGAQT